MADLDERLLKLKKVEQEEALRGLCREIDQQIQTMQVNTFRIHDEDLDSIKEDLVLDAAQKLARAVKAARKLQAELGG
jgi:cell division protein ZapA (FtsZ GTPase activity inhibitor)